MEVEDLFIIGRSCSDCFFLYFQCFFRHLQIF